MSMFDPASLPKVLELYLEISQYPILAPTIRERMRSELYSRGVISPSDLEREVKQKAIRSQKREGLGDPFAQEPADVWQRRLAHFRDSLTDFYFAHNLPHTLFAEVVRDVLAKRIPPAPPIKPRRVLSVTSCLRRRSRPAPRTILTEISRCRTVARASNRLATLVQAIKSKQPTATSRTRRAGRISPTV